jgi:hypothetical protein
MVWHQKLLFAKCSKNNFSAIYMGANILKILFSEKYQRALNSMQLPTHVDLGCDKYIWLYFEATRAVPPTPYRVKECIYC